MGMKLIYLGCLSSTKYTDTCENAIQIINKIDDEYKVLEEAPCCGALAYHITPDTTLEEHVNLVNDWFKKNNVEKIVTICAGCYNYLTYYYPKYKADEFEVVVEHLLQFMAKPENIDKLDLKYDGKKLRVCYHDACHLRNADIPIIDEPREILNSINKVEVFEMENNKLNSICCGAGGGVYATFKENSDYNTKSIFDQMRRGKALITACPFCYTAFKRVAEEENMKKPIIKFEDFIIKIMNGVDPLK
ncbi:MAG: hypothetical protein GF317_16275 [Candidatus Lokiarchaeota archaeon]|nr:hypothetical protein [Candidatus Lokiarchaeota archaeon]MBD3201091.1 hypothetical protein [Candidatus Lokiarchaeota archaeon]